ncbi:MAG: 2,3-bisphosphoglycerate-independent phosphoglycerate mutase [Deltaproteobacteria bacterium]|nr:2,3-bisphosphoglycerate-independent phosphoglycerate mutase [Deltaproteobacteria bacterium]
MAKPGGPVVLIVLDGFGVRKDRAANAIALARTPFFDRLKLDYPSTQLQASGLEVGLPAGQMGNSEVGHLNLGAGRVVYQDITRISRSIESGEMFTTPGLKAALQTARQGTLHLLGLVSDGGVHSSMDHLLALLKAAGEFGARRVFIHAFTDGRDTPPKSALTYLRQLDSACLRFGVGEIASVSGRFYAMDRDKRWPRVQRAYQALVRGEGAGIRTAGSAEKAVSAAYERGESDEFIEPTVISSEGKAKALIDDGSSVVFFNFRADRMRQLCAALTQQSFSGFLRGAAPKLGHALCMTTYDERFGLPVMFPQLKLANLLGEVVSSSGLRQLRIAESEKYAHVTYFFNGGSEAAFPGEDRVLIPSPREIETYDKAPLMALEEVTSEAIARIESGKYGFVLMNVANPDMVGHTGNLDAAISAVEAIDRALAKIVRTTLDKRGKVIVTADHGNVETMVDPETGEPHTAHTTNPVPFVLVDPARQGQRLAPGVLADVAPTVLKLLGLPIPAEMSGRALVE